jgi:hypothetical protein
MDFTEDGGCVFVGTSDSYGGMPWQAYQMLLVKLDSMGVIQWMNVYGDVTGIGVDYWGDSVVATSNGDYIIVGSGTTWIDQWWSYGLALKVDSVGNEEWLQGLACGGWLGGCGLHGIVEINDGDFIIVGSTKEWLDSTGYNVIAARLNEYTGVKDADLIQPYTYKLHPPYPNPFNAVVTVGFELPVMGKVGIQVYDVLGRKVGTLVDDVMPQGTHSARWDAGGTPSGIYFVQMSAKTFRDVKKVVLLK